MSPITHTALAGAGLRHGFFTRAGGVSEGRYASLNCGPGSDDAADAVRENRARTALALGVEPDALCTAWQIHSADALVVESPFSLDERPRLDALVTARPGIAVGVLTADCAPVLFADQASGVIGAAHAGWRGALAGIIEATVGAMEELGASRNGIAAVIGPAIGPGSYEVGPGFPDAFAAREPADERFFRPAARARHWMFDLPGYVTARLEAAGLGTVAAIGRDTYIEPDTFFSYRRTCHEGGGDYGRLLSAIALEA